MKREKKFKTGNVESAGGTKRKVKQLVPQDEYEYEEVIDPETGEKTYKKGKLAYRSGNYSLIPPYGGPARNITGNELGNLGEYGLYNVAADPAQQNNLAADRPQLLDSLKSVFFSLTEGYYRAEVEAEPLK